MRSVVWAVTTNGLYSIKLGYDVFIQNLEHVQWHRLVWHNAAVPRYSLCAWRCLHKKLVTLEVLKNQGFHLASSAFYAKKLEESNDHLFTRCNLAVWLLKTVLLKLGKQVSKVNELTSFFTNNFKGKGLCSTIGKLSYYASIYFLWKYKNNVVFNGIGQSKLKILSNMEHIVNLNLKDKRIDKKDNPKARKIASLWEIEANWVP